MTINLNFSRNAIKCILLTIFFIATNAANVSYAKTTYELLVYCKKAIQAEAIGETNNPEVTYCIGLVEGVSRSMAYTQYSLSHKLSKEEKICFPENATTGQLIRIAVSEIEMQPKLMHIDAVVMLMDVFTNTFKCKK